MNVEKAKTAVIIMLLILNLVIYLLIAKEANAFTLTAAQETAITTVLENNGVFLNAPVIRDFSPMRQLQMAGFDYGFMAGLLFHEDEDISHYATQRHIERFRAESGRITIENADIFYYVRHYGGERLVDINAQTARAISGAFLEQMRAVHPNLEFVYYSSRPDPLGYEVRYVGMYDGRVIGSNFLLFTVDDYGISNIFGRFVRPEGFIGSEHEIHSVDEALLALLRHLRIIHPQGDIFIEDIQMAYYLVTDGGANSLAAPAYMFTIRRGFESGADTINIFVNAYNNTVIRPNEFGL